MASSTCFVPGWGDRAALSQCLLSGGDVRGQVRSQGAVDYNIRGRRNSAGFVYLTLRTTLTFTRYVTACQMHTRLKCAVWVGKGGSFVTDGGQVGVKLGCAVLLRSPSPASGPGSSGAASPPGWAAGGGQLASSFPALHLAACSARPGVCSRSQSSFKPFAITVLLKLTFSREDWGW